MNELSETVETTDEIDTVGGPMTEQVATALNKIHSINDLLLSVRAHNALCNYFGYPPSIYQLATMKKSVLLSIRNIGRTTATEIECVVCNAIAQANITKPTPSSESIGNNAKIREALEYAEDELWAYGIFDASKRIASALAKPPRNCDLYDTKDEASKAFIVWYNTTYDLNGDETNEVSSCDLKHNVDGILHEYIDWLFAKTKGENDAGE